MAIPSSLLSVDSFSEMSWGTRRSSAHLDFFSEAPLLGAFSSVTNSSMMPSISWILSLPLKILDGSESALWVLPRLPVCSSKGEGLYEEEGGGFLCLMASPPYVSHMEWQR